MIYRPDIDGLRAVAVLCVMFFHFGIGGFRGGYIGVDIFFVISGYLITGIISTEISRGNYRVGKFYSRRARRIFPALFSVILATATAGAFLLYPPEILDLQHGIVSATTFLSNIYFYKSADYFAGWVESHPLLHIWSLAVEEQFYIFFPFLLYYLHKFRAGRATPYVLLALFTASLAVSIALTANSPQANFYLLPSRSWELMLGSLLALYGHRLPVQPWLRGSLALTGVLLIAFCVFFYSKQTPFPGAAALLPCFGAAFIIFAGMNGKPLVSRIIGVKPISNIGLISYSLYLWHWPLAVFFKAINVQEPTPLQSLGLVIATFGLAYLSWRLVEQPFRKTACAGDQRRVLTVSVLAIAGINLLALTLAPLNRALWPHSEKYDKIFTTVKYDGGPAMRAGHCFLTGRFNELKYFDRDDCLRNSSEQPNLLLIGDSHAAHFYPGLSTVLTEFNVQQATASGCFPVVNSVGARRCTQLMSYIFGDYLKTHPPQLVVLSGRWRMNILPDLERTVTQLQGQGLSVIILGPIVEYDTALPRVLARIISTGDSTLLGAATNSEIWNIDAALRDLSQRRGFRYISVIDAVCEARLRCTTLDDNGYPLQFDYGHLTSSGAALVVTRLKEHFQWPLKQ